MKPGGFLYLYECHPMLWALDDERDDRQLAVSRPYFEIEQPTEWSGEATYVDGPPLDEQDVLRMEPWIRRHRYRAHRRRPAVGVRARAQRSRVAGPSVDGPTRPLRLQSLRAPDGMAAPTEQRDLVPLMYSIKASRQG